MPSAGTSQDQSDPARALAVPSPTVYPSPSANDDAEAADAAAGYLRKRKRRRRALYCVGCCVSTIVVVGIVILVLALTVFKVKEPSLTVNNVWLAAVSVGPGSGPGTGRIPAPGTGLPAPVASNATLTADVSLENPNAAAFKFSQSDTDVYYKGEMVSVAYAPAGRVGAHGTDRMNVTIDLLADRIARLTNGTGLLFGQEYEFDTYTPMNGTVDVLGIIKKDIEIKLNCTIVVQVGGAAAAIEYGVKNTVQSKSVNCLADVSM